MTKKFKSILFLSLTIVLILSAVTILSACNSDPLQITFAPGDHYTFNSTVTEAVPGDVVTFNVTASAGYKIDKVFANSVECTLNADGSYSFNMPEEPVTVTATASAISVVPGPDDDADDEKPVPTTEKLSDGFMSFTGFCPDKISAFKNTYSAEISYDVTFNKVININDGTKSVVVSSSDQNVIPNSALRVYLEQDGTHTFSLKLYVDLNSLNTGVAFVSIYVEDDTNSSTHAEIVKKIEVVPENSLEIPRQSVSFTVDFSDCSNTLMEKLRGVSGLQLNVSDRYDFYSYAGEKTSTTFDIDIDELQDGKVTFNFQNYAAGHNYSVSISYKKPDGYYSFVDVNDHVNSDYSYINSQLTVNSYEAVTVQLKISG